MPSWWTGRCQEVLPAVRVVHLEVREGSGDPPDGPRSVGRNTQRSRRGWVAFTACRVVLGGPTGSPGGFERPSLWTGRCREAHTEVRESHTEVRNGLGGLHGGLGGVGRPSRRSGKDREDHSEA